MHTSETGSLDKVVLEALATDTPVVTTSDAYGNLPVIRVSASPDAIAAAFERTHERSGLSASIRKDHSLERLIPAIIQTLKTAQ